MKDGVCCWVSGFYTVPFHFLCFVFHSLPEIKLMIGAHPAKSQIGLCQCSPCVIGRLLAGSPPAFSTIYEGHCTALYCTGTRDVVLCLDGPGTCQ